MRFSLDWIETLPIIIPRRGNEMDAAGLEEIVRSPMMTASCGKTMLPAPEDLKDKVVTL